LIGEKLNNFNVNVNKKMNRLDYWLQVSGYKFQVEI